MAINDGAFQKLGYWQIKNTSSLKLIRMYRVKEHIIPPLMEGRMRGHRTPGVCEWYCTSDNDIKSQLLPGGFSSDRISANSSSEQ
jgi:hypothetical protein